MEAKKLAVAVIEFLQDYSKNLNESEKESLEVACQCITDVFSVDSGCKDFSVRPKTLLQIFSAACENSNATVDVAKAEKYKSEGNQKLAEKNFQEAVNLYTEAIALNPSNAIYYSNRSAAYSQMGNNQAAYDDAKESVGLDSSYAKGYSRLGLAALALKRYDEAIAAYKKAIELDPSNANVQAALKTAEAELSKSAVSANANEIPSSNGFDFASMMSNPNFMNMASQLMQSGALGDLMNNPNVAQMAQNMFAKNPDILKNFKPPSPDNKD